LSEAARKSTVVHGIVRGLLGGGLRQSLDDFVEGSIEGLSIVERMLEKAIGQFNIAGSDFINANYKSALELLQHQNDI